MIAQLKDADAALVAAAGRVNTAVELIARGGECRAAVLQELAWAITHLLTSRQMTLAILRRMAPGYPEPEILDQRDTMEALAKSLNNPQNDQAGG